MADPKEPEKPTEEQKILRNLAFHTKRSKNQFAFDSVDTHFPYGMAESGISLKKVVVFNYSKEYFRKKVGSGTEGLYQIIGGNIPTDMESTKSFPTTQLAGETEPPPPIVCNLNKGAAVRLRKLDALNLSPNLIQDFPTHCDEKAYPPPEIFFEKGKQQKPNFLYFPTYQNSSSTHPRANGFAHEDNYDCLKYYKGGAGDAPQRCCDGMGGCAGNFKLFYKGKETYEGVERDTFLENPRYLNTFYCGANPELMNCKETGNNPCAFGFGIKQVFVPGDIRKQRGCEKKVSPEGDDGKPVKGTDGESVVWYLVEAVIDRIFNGGGNRDCGCSGRGGKVSVAGYHECISCGYVSYNDPTPGPKFKRKCTEYPSDPVDFCECVYTSEPIDVYGDGKGIVYVSTLNYPTYKLANWKGIELTSGGGVRSAGCGGEVLFDCGDVS
jgi:hypothetical protein